MASNPPSANRALRVGIINIMPRVETYEPYLLSPLRHPSFDITPVWIRLGSHRYSSSDAAHIERHYRTFDAATSEQPLDGVILTGAPVEELAFEDVSYWPELTDILTTCRTQVTSTLGLCWGGLALTKLLGLEKRAYAHKLFGVFENRLVATEHPLLAGSDDVFRCAHSRHSGVDDAEAEALERAGALTLLTHGGETGYSIVASRDLRYVAHFGHPEYEAERLVHEWARDRAIGRADVRAPRHFDPQQPLNVWRSHRNQLFSRWLELLNGRRR